MPGDDLKRDRDVRKEAYDLGYRYMIEFESPEKKPLHVRTIQQAASLMRTDFKDEKNWRARRFDCNGRFDNESVFEKMVFSGIQIDHHASDLYVPVNPKTTAILLECKATASTFTCGITGELWYDIPFAYTPWWEERKGVAK